MADDRDEAATGARRAAEWRDVLAPEIMERYIGKHIAIVHKRIVAAGDTYDFVREEARKLYPDETPYLAYIPHAGRTPPEAEVDADIAPESGGQSGQAGGSASLRRRRRPR